MRSTFFWALALGLVSGTAASIHGAEIPIDDFDHMNSALSGWTKVDLSAGQPWGPGVYDPSSGALRIYHSGDELVPPGTPFAETAMFALWNDSTDPLYSNGYLRAQIRIDELNANAALEMRLDLSTATAYLLFGNTHPFLGAQGGLSLHKFVNGVETSLWESPSDGIELLPGEDWNVELGTVGSRISAKVWKVGDAEPRLPQFSGVDPDPILGGMIGISSDKTLGVPVPARADATFDDIYLTQIDFAPLTVDIKPGSYANPVNLKSKGVLPVAILSTTEFDASQVDLDTLLFGDPLLMADGKFPVSPLRGNYEDVNYDGLADLTLKFSMQDLLASEVIGAATMQGYLAGRLVDGTVIDGRDAISIVTNSAAIPEPGSVLLLAVGLAAIAARRR